MHTDSDFKGETKDLDFFVLKMTKMCGEERLKGG
jgi:hypothetical protein